MEVIGYICSILIGVVLGLIGGGGSILTVPVLVYLFGIEAVTATTYSLLIVGVTGLIGAIQYYQKKLVNLKTALLFGIPSVMAVFTARRFIVPAIPDIILQTQSVTVTKRLFLMLFFAAIMFAAAFKMIKPDKPNTISDTSSFSLSYGLVFIAGFTEGLMTGMVGAGGGFLIIPALVLLFRLPMKEAVGTSLLIIAMKTIVGFVGGNQAQSIDWQLILSVLGFAIVGLFIGMALSKKIDGSRLKPAFGWFVLVMSIYIVFKEVFRT